MINGELDAVEDLKYITQHKARNIISHYVKNVPLREDIVSGIKDNEITGFILKDIMKELNDIQTIKKLIQDRISLLHSS